MMKFFLFFAYIACFFNVEAITLQRTAEKIKITNAVNPFGAEVNVKPLSPAFGAEITGLKLTPELFNDPIFAENLKQAVAQYRVVVLRKANPSPEEHVSLATVLGEASGRASTQDSFDPSQNISRLSNNEKYGYYLSDHPSWHTHGVLRSNPYRYIVTHAVKSKPNKGTKYVPLKELYESQPEEVRKKWSEMTFVTENHRNQPFVYEHPDSGEPAMLFHLAEKDSRKYIRNFKQVDEEELSFSKVKEELTSAIEQSGLAMQVPWEEGDVVIADNLATAHLAPRTMIGGEGEDLRITDLINVRHRVENTTGHALLQTHAAISHFPRASSIPATLLDESLGYDSNARQLGCAASVKSEWCMICLPWFPFFVENYVGPMNETELSEHTEQDPFFKTKRTTTINTMKAMCKLPSFTDIHPKWDKEVCSEFKKKPAALVPRAEQASFAKQAALRSHVPRSWQACEPHHTSCCEDKDGYDSCC